MKIIFTLLFVLTVLVSKAQKVDSIFFNLYTDSLKKGVYNYINVDGKLSSGIYQPLMSDEIIFTSNGGRWDGNSIIIDSSFNKPAIFITVKLKSNPAVSKSITIFIKKFENQERLKTQQEILDEIRNNRKRNNLTT